MRRKKTIKCWVREHKTELLATGVMVATVAGTIILLKNKDLCKVLCLDAKNIPHVVPDTIPEMTRISQELEILEQPSVKIIDIKEYIRNLPEGYHASIEKISEAIEAGIELAENQTLVSAHTRSYAA